MKHLSISDLLRLLPLALMCLVSALILTSCESNDEPDMCIDYYLTIESRVPLRYTMDPRADMMFKITKQMKNAIDEVYSKHDMTGNDLQVIVACDYVFEQYCQTYVPGYQSSQCVLLLYRARRVNGLIRQSVKLKAYRL